MTTRQLALAAAEAFTQADYAESLGDRTTAWLWYADGLRLTRLALAAKAGAQ